MWYSIVGGARVPKKIPTFQYGDHQPNSHPGTRIESGSPRLEARVLTTGLTGHPKTKPNVELLYPLIIYILDSAVAKRKSASF